MDLAIKSLEELDARRRTINSEANLDQECQLIRELNDKIANLADKIKDLHSDTTEQHSILDINLEKLTGLNQVLSRTSKAFEVSSRLTKLNRLCNRLDTSPCLKFIASAQCNDSSNSEFSTGNSRTTTNSNGKSVNRNSANRHTRRYSGDDNGEKYLGDDDEDIEGLIIDKRSVHDIVMQLVREFDQVYTGQLRLLLEGRKDLPYVSYASMIERAKSYLDSC